MRLLNLALAALGLATLPGALGRPSDSVLLSKVKTLTLRVGKLTASRRTSPIPQLRCVGGNARPHFEVDAMRCTNVGADYDSDDPQWTCTADLPPEFKLGSTEVLCEGYSSPEDPYILKGSCGVEYRLQLTPRGEQMYGSHEGPMSWSQRLITTLTLLFIFGVFAFIIYDCCTGGNRTRTNRGPGGGGGGGWGGGPGDDGNDPPPPYSRMPPPKGSSDAAQNAGGFWNRTTAAMAGAAGGYMAGRAGGGGFNRDRYQDRYQDRWARPGPSYGSTRSDSGSSSRSSTTYQSTGFGGTTRR